MITYKDLKERGFEVVKQYPLYTHLQHKKNNLCVASVGVKYGEIFIGEKHWCNDEYERTFCTINSNLTAEDLDNIIKMLMIKI